MRESAAAVALIRRQENGQSTWLAQWNSKWQRYHFVGGHRQEPETFRDCLVRELVEELGLHELSDVVVAEQPRQRLEFVAWSESSHQQTRYTFELFEVEFAGESVIRKVDANPQNRWVSEAEMRQGGASDGRLISPTMFLVMSQAKLAADTGGDSGSSQNQQYYSR